MNCFEHRSSTAIAICSSCVRGVCPLCVSEHNEGITCQREECQEQMRLRYQINNQYKSILTVSNSKTKINSYLLFIMGLFFLSIFFSALLKHENLGIFEYGTAILGVAFIIFAGVDFTKKYKLPK